MKAQNGLLCPHSQMDVAGYSYFFSMVLKQPFVWFLPSPLRNLLFGIWQAQLSIVVGLQVIFLKIGIAVICRTTPAGFWPPWGQAFIALQSPMDGHWRTDAGSGFCPLVPGFCLSKVQGPRHFKQCLRFTEHISSIPWKFYPYLASKTHLFHRQEAFIECLLCARCRGYGEEQPTAANLRMLPLGHLDSMLSCAGV